MYIDSLIHVYRKSMKEVFGEENYELAKFYSSINRHTKDPFVIYREYERVLQFNAKFIEKQKAALTNNLYIFYIWLNSNNNIKEINTIKSNDESVSAMKSLIGEFSQKNNNEIDIRELSEYNRVFYSNI